MKALFPRRLPLREPAMLPVPLLVLALLLASACKPEGSAGRERPNVVFIVIDTLRADRLPFYGYHVNTAPFLDSLARQSLVFENAWSASSWTAPATASLFTGLYPNQHGVRLGLMAGRKRQSEVEGYQLNRIPNEIETLPTFMKRLGYRTFGVSSNPNIGQSLGFERGFDHFAPFDRKLGSGADLVEERLLAWKDEILAGGPFLLYLHFSDPHGPYERHEEWIESKTPPPPNNFDDGVAYDSEIRFADESIRRIFGELGLSGETFVVMTADHGQEFLDHGQHGHGWQLYSELTRVPLFIHRPPDGTAEDQKWIGRVSANVSTVDLLATLQALLDPNATPARFERSLAAAIGADGLGRRQAFSMRTGFSGGRTPRLNAIVVGRFKLIVHEPGGRRELYDLRTDPQEQRDLAEELPDVEARLLRALQAQREYARATGRRSAEPYVVTPEIAELLRELGYAEGGVNSESRRVD